MIICASSPTLTPNALLPWAVGGSRTAGAVGRTHADCLHAGKLPDFRWSLERIHESDSVLPTAAPGPDFVNRRISTFCLGDYRRIPDLCLIFRTRYGRFRCESKISRLLPRWPYRQAIRTRLPAYPAPHTQLPARRIPHIQWDNHPQPPERVDGEPTPDPTGSCRPAVPASTDAEMPVSVGRRLKCAHVHAVATQPAHHKLATLRASPASPVWEETQTSNANNHPNVTRLRGHGHASGRNPARLHCPESSDVRHGSQGKVYA